MINNTRHRVFGRSAATGTLALALILAGIDLAVKAYAKGPSGFGTGSIDLGVVQLRLAYNSGVAFSVGAGLPDLLIVIATGVIVICLAGFTWRAAGDLPLLSRLALGSILGGALGNLVDRARDGVVTDYLYTGWWPTFNLADIFITIGAVALFLSQFVFGRPSER